MKDSKINSAQDSEQSALPALKRISGTASKNGAKDFYEFNIAGLPFRLRSSQDEETVRNLVQFVDQKIQQAVKATKSGSVQSAAVLAALNIAEELILLKKRAIREIEAMEDRALRLAQDLDQTTKTSKGVPEHPVSQ